MKLRLFWVITLGLFFTNVLHARDFDDCLVEEIFVREGSGAFVKIDCTIQNTPTCATSNTYFAIDNQSETGKQTYSLTMMAFAANMKISGFVINTENSCPIWQSNIPMLRFVTVKK